MEKIATFCQADQIIRNIDMNAAECPPIEYAFETDIKMSNPDGHFNEIKELIIIFSSPQNDFDSCDEF